MRGFTGNPVRIVRDEDDIDVYYVDLSIWLAGDTLTGATVINESGVTVDSVTVLSAPVTIPNYGDISASSAVVVKLSGGARGVSGRFDIRVTTATRSRDIGYGVDTV